MSLLSTTPSSTSLFFPKTPVLHPHQAPSLSPFPNLNLRSSPPSLSLSSSRLSSSSRTFSSLNNTNNTNDEEEQDDTKSSPLGRGSWAEKLEKGAEKFEKRGENIAKGVENTGEKIIDTITGRGGPTKKNKKPNPTDLVERITVSDDEWGEKSQPDPVSDEWGEKSEPEPETPSKFPGVDPPIREDEDEWGPDDVAGNGGVQIGSGSESEAQEEMKRKEKIMELKRGLVDSVYGSNFGFGSSLEVRAEVSELVTQLEALNPTPNPTDVPALLDGNWVLVYTAFSELLPLLAVGTTPLLKVQKVSQAIDTGSGTVENLTTLSSPFATFSFSATASFEVRSPSRIQVQFKEATFKPPEIKSQFDLPNSVIVFGQTVTLSPVQQLLNPLQEAAASISRSLYGLPPLKIPIPGERTQSWLLVTYLDDDFRISRGDGGLFVLIREGSPLLDQ